MQAFVRSWSDPLFFLVVLFGLAFAGVAFAAAIHARRRTAVVKRMKTSNIGMAAEGYCELEGTVEAIDGEPLTAPLSKSACVWHHMRLERMSTKEGSTVVLLLFARYG